LARHPKLMATMAHLYFVSDDMDHGEQLLSRYENFRFDITPGTEMYSAFMADREKWAAFFRRWQDKLDFGTDMPDWTSPDRIPPRDDTCDLITKTLAGTEYFEVLGCAGKGLGLEKSVLDKIFVGNFERINGKNPKPLNENGLAAYADWLLPRLNREQRQRAERLLEG